MTTMYDLAREEYAALGIDTEAVMEKLAAKPISVHCWQGDDVLGFDQEGGLSGGIQTTGNYPGRARTFEELTADFEAAMALVPGAKRINLHASYAVFTDENPWVDRDTIEYKHFEPWVAWAKAHGYGIDFNPTIFGHPMMNNELSLSSPDKATRDFWIRHCKACRKISQQIGEALDDQTLCNIWIPDGLKDVPGDRYGLRERLRDSLDEIYAEKYDRVIDSCESKVFGIGLESMTVGSNEFYLAYAATHPGVYDLLDLGHFHPTENVADKLSSLLLFFDKVPLHVTRPVRWDSDHVVLFDDPTKEVAMEIAHIPGAWEKVIIGLDFFDASINRVGAWATGTRAMEKSLLYALLQPGERLKELQDTYQFTEKMMLAEQAKSMPFGAVWDGVLPPRRLPARWRAVPGRGRLRGQGPARARVRSNHGIFRSGTGDALPRHRHGARGGVRRGHGAAGVRARVRAPVQRRLGAGLARAQRRQPQLSSASRGCGHRSQVLRQGAAPLDAPRR